MRWDIANPSLLPSVRKLKAQLFDCCWDKSSPRSARSLQRVKAAKVFSKMQISAKTKFYTEWCTRRVIRKDEKLLIEHNFHIRWLFLENTVIFLWIKTSPWRHHLICLENNAPLDSTASGLFNSVTKLRVYFYLSSVVFREWPYTLRPVYFSSMIGVWLAVCKVHMHYIKAH